MELLGLLDVPGWLLTVLLIIACLYLYSSYKQSIFKRYGIPLGPKPTLFLGSLPEFVKKGMFQMAVDNVQKYGKFFGSFIGNIPTVIVSDPEMIKEIAVKQFSSFQDRTQSLVIPKFWRQALNNATGSHWRLLRTTISPTFSSGKMRKMETILHKCLDSFIEVLDNKDPDDVVDMQALFSSLTLDVICSSAFGVECDSQRNPEDSFVKNAKDALNFSLASNPFFLVNFLFPESKHLLKYITMPDSKALVYIKEATKRVIEERKSTKDSEFNDLLQLLIDAHQDSPTQANDDIDGVQLEVEKKRRLTEDEILANSVMFLLAGSDTTATALTWLAFCLVTNLDVQEKLIAEIDNDLHGEKPNYDNVFKLQYLDMVLSETLRLYSPVTRSNRQVVHDTVICGKTLPGGVSVTFPISGMHRLPEFWPEPEKFNPDRFSSENKTKINRFAYLPFGLGPRNCVGMRLALFEVKMAIVALLQRYKITPSDKLQNPPKIGKSIIVKPEGGIWVKLVKR